MHHLHGICHRGPIDRVLSRLIGDHLPYTKLAICCPGCRMRWAFRRDGRLITRREAHAEAGQGTLIDFNKLI